MRRFLSSFEPYGWEPSSEAIAARYGIPRSRVTRFDLNTSPYTPRTILAPLSRELPEIEINQYPDTSYSRLAQRLSQYAGIPQDQIMVTNGADESLDIISKVFIDPGSRVVLSTPTYSLYRIMTKIMDGIPTPVRRKEDFRDDVDGLIRAGRDADLVILCSPNNPTGNLIETGDLLRLLESFSTPVVIDEAYYEFCGRTSAGLIQTHENLIVVRTFSKAFSMAGVRVGYTLASKRMMEVLNRVRPPNSLSVISLRLAEAALDRRKVMEDSVRRIMKEKARLTSSLGRIEGLKVYPSEANFLLVKIEPVPAVQVYESLLKRGMVVREFAGNPDLQECIRITVGTPTQNASLVKALGEILVKPRRRPARV